VSVTSVSNSNPTRTSASLLATSNVNGIYYWYVAPEGTNSVSAQELQSQVGDYFNLVTGEISGVKAQVVFEVRPNESDTSNEE